jgi:hypothetical protein
MRGMRAVGRGQWAERDERDERAEGQWAVGMRGAS